MLTLDGCRLQSNSELLVLRDEISEVAVMTAIYLVIRHRGSAYRSDSRYQGFCNSFWVDLLAPLNAKELFIPPGSGSRFLLL